VLFTSVFFIVLSISGAKTETDAEKADKTVVNKTSGNMPPGVISVLSAPNSSMLIPARYKLLISSAVSDGSCQI
jgi:hypothetical protein